MGHLWLEGCNKQLSSLLQEIGIMGTLETKDAAKVVEIMSPDEVFWDKLRADSVQTLKRLKEAVIFEEAILEMIAQKLIELHDKDRQA
jgi:hypothetical protein